MPGDDLVELVNQHLGGHNRQLGLRFTHAGPDVVEAVLQVGPEHLQPYGLVHGGVYASMVETLCSTGAALAVFEEGLGTVGLDNHTSFLRACRGGTLTGRATPLATGRRTQLWEASITDEEGRRVAVGRVRLLCLPPEAIFRDGSTRREG